MNVACPARCLYFFASLKIPMTVGFVGSIVAETVAANKGIGYLMLVASRPSKPEERDGAERSQMSAVGAAELCAWISRAAFSPRIFFPDGFQVHTFAPGAHTVLYVPGTKNSTKRMPV